MDVLSDQLRAGEITEKQALMQARKLEATTPYTLEIQGFIGNLLWTLDLKDEAADVYERAYARARAQIPADFHGRIPWGEVDNRPFLRIAHGTLLGLMHRHGQAGAMDEAQALATELLAWCPMDNLGVRFLRGDIAFLQGDYESAQAFYLEGAYDAPAHWYQAALIAFREADFVTACTYLRRGMIATISHAISISMKGNSYRSYTISALLGIFAPIIVAYGTVILLLLFSYLGIVPKS